MATNLIGGGSIPEFGAQGSAAGITEVTNTDFEMSYGIQTPVKNAQGEVVGFLLGKPKATMRVEGYVTATNLSLNQSIEVMGYAGKGVKTTVRQVNDDLVKGTIEGIAIL